MGETKFESDEGMIYYNENDPKAAAWLRELIAHNLIAPGIIDERSITEINYEELKQYTQCHFFAGIGGWSYALRLADWPDDCPVWTGSCPCQPFSVAGKGLGTADERHLWPIFAQLIRQCKPATVFGEQVASKAGRAWLAGIRSNLENMGYAVGASDLCAAGVGAPHIRQRLYWVAHSRSLEFGRLPSSQWEALPTTRGNSKVSGLAHDPSTRLERSAGSSIQGGVERRLLTRSSEFSGLANPVGTNEQFRTEAERQTELAGRSPTSGLANPDIAERRATERVIQTEEERFQLGTGGNASAWDNYELVSCRDGKARRIESGTFPLAHGIPGRVGLLRGYGNAIVPQLAAEFIQASKQAINDAI